VSTEIFLPDKNVFKPESLTSGASKNHSHTLEIEIVFLFASWIASAGMAVEIAYLYQIKEESSM
jgi:hypothetical protein